MAKWFGLNEKPATRSPKQSYIKAPFLELQCIETTRCFFFPTPGLQERRTINNTNKGVHSQKPAWPACWMAKSRCLMVLTWFLVGHALDTNSQAPTSAPPPFKPVVPRVAVAPVAAATAVAAGRHHRRRLRVAAGKTPWASLDLPYSIHGRPY